MDKLTGKFYHEVEGVWSKSLVLYVEVTIHTQVEDPWGVRDCKKHSHTTWRKATMKDLHELHCMGMLPNGR